jgi:hypothetical protein
VKEENAADEMRLRGGGAGGGEGDATKWLVAGDWWLAWLVGR